MAKHTKYGWCPIVKRWIPRDDMRSINVKAFDEDNNEERIRLRLSPVGHEMLTKYLRDNAWNGVMREEQDLFPDGLSDDERKSKKPAPPSSHLTDTASSPWSLGFQVRE